MVLMSLLVPVQIDASLALLLQENDLRGATITRHHQPRRVSLYMPV